MVKRPVKHIAKKSIEYTIHLHKYVHGKTFKKRAPTAVKVIREFAEKAMKTKDVRLDPELNRHLWHRGIRNVPVRIRVRLSRRRDEGEETNKSQLYTHVTWVPVVSFKGKW
jgi:large subunit ribosomal protein L31e